MVWRYGFEKMGIEEDSDYTDKKIIVTEAAWNPDKNRLAMMDCCFNKLGFDSMQITV